MAWSRCVFQRMQWHLWNVRRCSGLIHENHILQHDFLQSPKKIFDSQVVYQFALKVAPNLPFTFQLQWKMTRHVNFSSSCAAVVWFFLMHASKAVAWSLYNIQLSRDDWTFGKLWIWIWLIIWPRLAHHFIEHFIHRWNPCRTVSQECGGSLRTRQPKCPGETRWNPLFKALWPLTRPKEKSTPDIGRFDVTRRCHNFWKTIKT